MIKLAVVDCDDVILDWKSAYVAWMQERGWECRSEEYCTAWDMSEWFYNFHGIKMTSEMNVEYIKEFNSFPRVLKPLYGIGDNLAYLRSEGYRIVVLSSFANDLANKKFRQDYLNMMFPDMFEDVVVLGLGECKENTLKALNPDIFIEDNKSHAEKAVKLGIKTYLISTSYNQGCDGAIYFKNWNGFKL